MRISDWSSDVCSSDLTRFLANMSHELRTPLNAIIGFSEVMASEALGPIGAPRYAGYARDILDSGRHLLDLINDILEMSRIEAGSGKDRKSVEWGKSVSGGVSVGGGRYSQQKKRTG